MRSPTSDPDKSLTEIVRAGFDRACAEFDIEAERFGFAKARKRIWTRPRAGKLDLIYLERGGVGRQPRTASVDIRARFSIVESPLRDPIALNGPDSDKLRASSGYGYHLRFNAASGSTYDRCIEDLKRVLTEHGLPWFARSGV